MSDYGICSKIDIHADTAFSFNVMFHVLILFTILSALFTFVISKLEEDAFKKEIETAFSESIPKTLNKYDTDGKLKDILKGVSLEKLKLLYNKSSDSTVIYNTWLKRFMLTLIISLILLITISALFLGYSCNKCLPMGTIIKTNLVIFLFIGIFEFFFFKKIAQKYVPAPPSLLTSRVFDDLKKW